MPVNSAEIITNFYVLLLGSCGNSAGRIININQTSTSFVNFFL